jgi:hypothetical protein
MKSFLLLLLAGGLSIQIRAQGSLQITPGTTLKSTGGVYIVLNNTHLKNDGSFQQSSGDGILKFTGNTDVTLSGNGTSAFDHLLLVKDGSALTLQKNITVLTKVNFGGGLLNLGNSILDLGSNGVLENESADSRLHGSGTGYVQVNTVLNAPSMVNPGNLGAVITSSANLGNTVIRRGHTAQTNLPGSSGSILRYYEIAPANNTNLNGILRLHYADAELNGLNGAALDLWKSSDNSTWSHVGSDARDVTLNYVEKTGVNDFSRWTLAVCDAKTTYYQDSDGDGFGNAAVTISVCSLTPPPNYVSNNTDCDDADASLNPNTMWYKDADGDGFAAISTVTSCTSPGSGYTRNMLPTTDCDDTKKLYADNDGDGFGSTFMVACGGVENNTDCNDDTGILYADTDGDGYGSGAPAPCGVSNNTDNCPAISNPDQKDLDKDGTGDACDPITNVAGAVTSLKNDIQAMNISAGTKQSLNNKLDAAQSSCAAGNTNAAIGQLNAFINEVNAKRGKEFTTAQADDLVARASALSNAIKNGTADCGSAAPTSAGISRKLPEDVAVPIKERLALQVMPNPSATYFRLRLTSNNDKLPMSMQVIDQYGRLIEIKSGIAANSTFRLGDRYRPGMYYVEAIHGKIKTTVKLVKQAD